VKKRRKNKWIHPKILYICLSVLCVLLVLLSFKFTDRFAGVKAFVGNVVTPMQKGINSVGKYLSDKADLLTSKEILLAENKELQEKLNDLSYNNKILARENAELDNYRELYKLDKVYPDYPKVAANVIASENSNWFSKFTIDKGSNDGIREDMNVLSGTGLVGIVTEVGPNWATVSSIIDDKNVSAMILTTFDKCIVSGDLQTVQDGLLKFEQLANNENEVAVGEQVVTSNISSKYLQGLLVGYISEVNVDSNNLTRSGYIIPATDFKELQEVLVITTTKQDLIDGKGESGSDNGGE